MKEKIKQRLRQYFSSVLCLRLTCIVLAVPPCRPAGRHFFTFHSSLFIFHLAPPAGELSPKGTEGATTAVPLFFCRALRARGANLLQTCDPRGLPGPGPRMTFCPARKSSKSRLREGGFRFPPSLKNPISLKRPRPGAAAPALDPAPAGRKPGNFSLFIIH